MELPKNIEVIFTHCGVDLDACASVWAVRKFHPGARHAVVHFRPANWNGDEMGENGIAVDMDVNGRGWKGEKEKKTGVVHSCFASIMAAYAPREAQRALKYLVAYVDLQDAEGSVVYRLAPNLEQDKQMMLSANSLNEVLWSLSAKFRGNDRCVLARMVEIFDGYLFRGLAFKRAQREAGVAEIVGEKREVAIHRGSEHAAHSILFARGVRVIVAVDGLNLGIRRGRDEKLRMDHPALRAVVEAAGEKIGNGEGLWYPHPAGFLFCRGTRPKAPATSPSKVDPRRLALVAAGLIAAYDVVEKAPACPPK